MSWLGDSVSVWNLPSGSCTDAVDAACALAIPSPVWEKANLSLLYSQLKMCFALFFLFGWFLKHIRFLIKILTFWHNYKFVFSLNSVPCSPMWPMLVCIFLGCDFLIALKLVTSSGFQCFCICMSWKWHVAGKCPFWALILPPFSYPETIHGTCYPAIWFCNKIKRKKKDNWWRISMCHGSYRMQYIGLLQLRRGSNNETTDSSLETGVIKILFSIFPQ